ncbi:hypothetical protein RvY_13347 [Ramazzottius varieornatus]|uniref:Receptor ligand binding region domain-containing protein n=1 Tax=Ramazzottius varieornatus TaxID=947166 RepID=A0A1D1VW41_RAMVA|nr:hypothetical protein RvY_13347 [Ramazzottius varieornatus]
MSFSSAGDSRLANKQRYPTTLTAAGVDHTSMPRSLLALLDCFKWRTVTTVCDALSQFPGVNAFFIVACANLRLIQSQQRTKYNFYNFDFDSKFASDYAGFLLQAKKRSRGKQH